jgi:hypothetical protein
MRYREEIERERRGRVKEDKDGGEGQLERK